MKAPSQKIQLNIGHLKGLIYGIAYGLIARGLIEYEFNRSDMSTSGLMTFSFLFLVPLVIGFITTYKNRDIMKAYKAIALSMPVFSVLGVVLLALLFDWEGLICALMAIPVFVIMALIDGFVGIRMFKRKPNRLQVSVLLLLPLILAQLEREIGLSEKIFHETTSILVDGADIDIWEHITSVYTISEDENQSSLFQFMGFPRPLEATLDTVTVGGIRIAKFNRGLFFTETVTRLKENRLLEFSIVADPSAIPPEALDEHVLVGGNYFDVMNGKYEILPTADENIYEIRLTSQFRLSTSFNFYSGFWCKRIMRDIQTNILRVLKKRVERMHQ